jgi:hypothetical protein
VPLMVPMTVLILLLNMPVIRPCLVRSSDKPLRQMVQFLCPFSLLHACSRGLLVGVSCVCGRGLA